MEQLKLIALVERVTAELKAHLGLEDALVAEYLVERARRAGDEDSYFVELNKEDESVTYELATQIFALTKAAFPQSSPQPAPTPPPLPVVEKPEQPNAPFVELEIDFQAANKLIEETRKVPRIERRRRRDSRDTFSSSESEDEELVVGGVFRGEIVKVFDYGLLVRAAGGKRQTGLVHISKVREERVEDLRSLFAVGQKVFVKCVERREDGKVAFSMRDVDQKTGRLAEREEGPAGRRSARPQMDPEELRDLEAFLLSQEYGMWTGIKLDFKGGQKRGKATAKEVDLWEASR